MINVHEELLDNADEQEMYLIMQVARHMNKENFAFPSTKRLCKLTKWDARKVRKVKNRCIDKNFFETFERKREDGGRTSDGFRITTDGIGVFVSLKGKGDTPPNQNGEGGTDQKCQGPPNQNGEGNEVLLNISSSIYSSVVDCLNEELGTKYKASSKKTQSLIHARAAEGATIDDFKKVIRHMAAKWGRDSKMSQYLRPVTLFGTKFESYLQDAERSSTKLAARHEDVDLPAELQEKYNEYLDYVSQHYPTVTATIAYLSKSQFKKLKERKYAAFLGMVGPSIERKEFSRAHRRFENNDPAAVKHPGVWEFFVQVMQQVTKETTTI